MFDRAINLKKVTYLFAKKPNVNVKQRAMASINEMYFSCCLIRRKGLIALFIMSMTSKKSQKI